MQTCAYMVHKNMKGGMFFQAHVSQGPPKLGTTQTSLQNPHVLRPSVILFTVHGHVHTENAI